MNLSGDLIDTGDVAAFMDNVLVGTEEEKNDIDEVSTTNFWISTILTSAWKKTQAE